MALATGHMTQVFIGANYQENRSYALRSDCFLLTAIETIGKSVTGFDQYTNNYLTNK